MNIESSHLNGLVVLQPEVFQDDRGFFLEAFRTDIFSELGLPTEFVQHNHSGSVKDVVRGLHFQWEPPMGKLMRVTSGTAFLVAVDIRKGSPSLGKWYGREVSAENKLQVYAPAGFARGFCVLSDYAEIQYICTGIYSGKGESGIRWNDPAIGVEWPVKTPILSGKDEKAQLFSEWLERPESDFFKY
ncbi:MAG: dTDP-4-dehydrorhamnose 3,5-epimerase [Chitinophagales bacterium]|nr:dTDP-4-dehydrorhamnose 3,5-epimerase [Chitinophagales bacterium]